MDANTLYRRWLFDAWTGDYAVLGEILAPGFVGHWPAMDVHGPDGAAEQIRQSHAYFSGITTTLDVGPLVDGDLLAARWTFHGSYQGGIPGATAAPGAETSFAGHDIFRTADGRFAEYWSMSDGLGMMAALGAL